MFLLLKKNTLLFLTFDIFFNKQVKMNKIQKRFDKYEEIFFEFLFDLFIVLSLHAFG